MCRDVTGDERDDAEHERGRDECEWVANADVGQQRLRHKRRQYQRGNHADGQPESHQEEAVAEHQSQHARGLCAERHAYADLTRALRHRVIRHAVQPD